MLGDDLRAVLGDAIPRDHARQAFTVFALQDQLRALGRPDPLVLDLGCGRGEGLDFVRAVLPQADWLGVDLPSSPEVDERPPRTDAEFRSFDGIHIPVADASVDVVYTQQVFEHVERPEPLLAEVARVLKPGGIFCGSLSQLEPFHSLSVGGFTPYGWQRALARADLQLVEVRPGIDAATLILRRLLRRVRRFDRYWVHEAPGNRCIDSFSRIRGLDPQSRNALKLMLAGQFVFIATR